MKINLAQIFYVVEYADFLLVNECITQKIVAPLNLKNVLENPRDWS